LHYQGLKYTAALAEQIRAKRRLDRKQFKVDRATAMLDAAKAAEAILTSGQTPMDDPTEDGSQAGGIDMTKLTAQTFLVRPTRPDANRNRGRKPFKRRPPPVASTAAGEAPGQAVAQISVAVPMVQPVVVPVEEEEEGSEEDPFDVDMVQEMEHLQLGLEEAWFLAASLGVLKIIHPESVSNAPSCKAKTNIMQQTVVPLSALLALFLTPPSPTISVPYVRPSLYVDDPFLVSYVAYHHFRSLGWVVKPGIKFCCDWLLYRRGPVFSHSAFSIAIIPVYSDVADMETSPYGNEDWYEERQSWKWINTVMRVNSLVQKVGDG
jgi:tRNA-splicing endonuclease subunit Sen2